MAKSKDEKATANWKRMYRVTGAFKPDEPLPANDPRYVDFDAERGSAGLVSLLARNIRMASSSTCQLISGHRGCGKTTEINLLKEDLETNDPRYLVVKCETDEYVAVNDVDYPDVLLALAQQVMIDAHQKGIKLKPGPLRTFLEDLKDILVSVVTLSKAKVKTPLLEFDFDIKKNRDNRHKVRDHLRERATPFLDAVNEVIDKAQKLLPAEYKGLVVIMDNLDRVYRNPVPGKTDWTSHEVLFVDASDYLRNINCHVLYTIPPALRYSPAGAKLAALYGNQPVVMPMIPVNTRTGAADEKGIARLEEAIAKRVQVASQLDLKDAFAPGALKRLCCASGGYVRSLFTLVLDALAKVDDFPITTSAVEQAIRKGRDAMIDAISPKPKRWLTLREVFKSKAPVEADEYLALLDNLIVLEYRDHDGPWHDVHPLAQEAREFKVPTS
jgi:hypothetical protein